VSLTLLLLVAYSLLMAVIGLWIGRHVRATGGFFVAGRRSARPLFAVPGQQYRCRFDHRRATSPIATDGAS
jgi:Na+/proline symporter